MKLWASCRILASITFNIQTALIPTVLALLKRPYLVLDLRATSSIFMAHVWASFANAADVGNRPTKSQLITPNAHGVVLDIGAGHGHAVKYLDPERVTKYFALEPNALMHSEIRQRAEAAGYCESAGTLLVLGCGAEDAASIRAALGVHTQVHTLISILALCSIPEPEQTLRMLVGDVLAPGGQLLFYEHVLSPRADVAWWQRFWTPIWRVALVGCCLDRPTDFWIENMGIWAQGAMWGWVGQEEESLFWHSVGRVVKAYPTGPSI
ncbi:hypothetical protein B0H10DRAFT_2179224 [Mycena sp. CBHHK59/15]|nr:hypothetical protein B0H10DRAFT_2179224 [Mycena sp. CBHHK59/15]